MRVTTWGCHIGKVCINCRYAAYNNQSSCIPAAAYLPEVQAINITLISFANKNVQKQGKRRYQIVGVGTRHKHIIRTAKDNIQQENQLESEP